MQASAAAQPASPEARSFDTSSPDAITGAATRERVRAFDLARGLAIVFMIGVHVLWHWGAPDTWTSPIGQVISFLGGPTAAPVFMFLMGASLAFSSRTSFSSLAVRGLWLLWLGYLARPPYDPAGGGFFLGHDERAYSETQRRRLEIFTPDNRGYQWK